MDAHRKDLGILAAVSLAVCCGMPLLLGAATLAATGVLVGSLAVVALGIGLVAVAVGRAARHRRVGDRYAGCACDVPTTPGPTTDGAGTGPGESCAGTTRTPVDG